MIAAQKNGHVESNLTSDQQVKMGIDPSAFAHIMSILTDLYSNRILAVIREYSTNAWDAQVEAGVNRPIEVTLPTRFNPHFAVRDFGVGLSVEDIHRIYSQYGASTKRGTNDQVGMLGLGCKSALTYTSQFTVTSIQSGTKVQVIVSRDADGTGSMHIADTCATSDADGTTITVPVMVGDIDRFKSEAHTFFSYWPKGHVTVDGAEVARVVDDAALKITDSIYVVKEADQYAERKHRVVMGNVAYPAPKLSVNVPRGHSIVAFVGIGAVSFAPSREALMDGQDTDATLRGIEAEYQKGITATVEREIRNASSHYAALKAKFEWEDFIPAGATITYKGEALPTKLKHPLVDAQNTSYPRYHAIQNPTPADRPYTVKSPSYKTRTDELWQVNADLWDRFVWVHGWDYAKLSRTQAAKIEKYLADNNIGVPPYGGEPRVALHPKPFPHAKWCRPGTVIDWRLIEAVQLPKPAKGMTFAGQRLAGSFDCYVNGDWKSEVDANDIDQKHALYYYAGPSAYSRCALENRVLRLSGRPFTIVTMPSNREQKFLRDFPKAKPLHGDIIKEEYAGWLKGLTADQREALAAWDEDHYTVSALREIDPSKVKDPALKHGAKIARVDLTKLVESRKLFQNALPWGTVKQAGGTFKNPLEKYPLFNASGMRSNPSHTYWYLNAAFAANV